MYIHSKDDFSACIGYESQKPKNQVMQEKFRYTVHDAWYESSFRSPVINDTNVLQNKD